MLKIAVPNKGRLSEATIELFRKAGLHLADTRERKLFATALDGRVQVLFLRAQDIPEFVQDGVAHLGITGADIIAETGKKVDERLDLGFGLCKLIVAVPDKSEAKTAADIPDGSRVASSFPRLTRDYFAGLGKQVAVVEVSGATELTPSIGVADAIVDLTSSGSTLAMNKLRQVGTIMTSTARVIAVPNLPPDLETLTASILSALESVRAARGKRYLMANVPRDRLDAVRAILPGITGPTIMDILSHGDMLAVHAVVPERGLFELIEDLKELGATGLLVLPIERLVP